ncbi:putative ribonuclease H-like domain-containing protein [Tanacetum coccineum]
MCDKKNSVLFTNTEYVVLSPYFNLIDESHVLFKVPRKDNMYSVDLKNVIPQGGIENLIDLKVKVIRCGNGTEFKNRIMNQFCEIKGIKRKFSVARTPQPNGVVERKNKTLIEAARTMLADSKLPTTFWAEAVNSACYVQNRVLVIKPHNKTHYELFLGYSTNSKAFRVFNSRTRIVEENLHVQFSENIPNIAGSGPNWLFDIDALTKSMNYKPVAAWNQSNGSAGTKACDNAGKARMETVSGKDYILLPLWTQDSSFSSSLKDSPDTRFKPSGEEEKKDTEDSKNENSKVPSTEEPRVNQEKDDNVSSTNNVNTASVNSTNTINTVSPTINAAGIEVNAVDPKSGIKLPDDLNMPELEDIVNLDDDEDVGAEAGMNNLDAFMPVSPIPTIRIHKDHPMDVKSAFLYGKIEEEVYVCQQPGFEDPYFPDRVYKVEKALYGLHQAPRDWYETLSTYLLDNRFQRGKIDKTLFIRRDKGDILRRKMEFLSVKTHVTEILKKFGFTDVKTTSAPMETQKSLLKDEDGEEVDVHLYRSMIGSLMYLTSSRPDIMFAVCACVRYQVNPKFSHLHAVKRIFIYLKGQPKLGLWYPKDSPFDLVAYTDSDYVRASLDMKSTTRGCQFLGCRLISWQCKKQTKVANSTNEAEYIAASNCCGHVL